jgi:hypothetical protein
MHLEHSRNMLNARRRRQRSGVGSMPVITMHNHSNNPSTAPSTSAMRRSEHDC